MISIHAPREGRDDMHAALDYAAEVFQSTRPARGATPPITPVTMSSIFQSTRPARGATTRSFTSFIKAKFQSTRPARGATLTSHKRYRSRVFQSTRPARGATKGQERLPDYRRFQSTRPARGATETPTLSKRITNISIHAPREGRDCETSSQIQAQYYFNPRAPRGARRKL